MIDKILLEVIGQNGVDSQLEQLSEECLELALAVRKYLRAKKEGKSGEDHLRNLFEETADVKIMLRQVELIFTTENVDKWVFQKMSRLKSKLESNV